MLAPGARPASAGCLGVVALSLDGLAAVARARGRPDRAARLLGAASARHEGRGLLIQAAEQHERALRRHTKRPG